MAIIDIICLCGHSGSGKTSLADYIAKKYGYISLNIGDTIKSVLLKCFSLFYNIDVPKKYLYNRCKEYTGFNISSQGLSRKIGFIYKNPVQLITINPTTNKEITNKEITYRNYMRIFGNDIMKKIIGEDLWIRTLSKKIKSIAMNANEDIRIIIADVRYECELTYLKKKFKKITSIKLERQTNDVGNHSSELIDFDTDHIISNDGSKEELFSTFDHIMKKEVVDNNMILL